MNTTTFYVELLAFNRDPKNVKLRPVAVPNADLGGSVEAELQAIFKWGQNDFQPVEGCYSVSCGDVIRYGGPCGMVRRFQVMGCGFKELMQGEKALDVFAATFASA